MRVAVRCAIACAVLVGAATASAGVVTKTVTTTTYRVTLDVGPLETMYTQAEVNAKHPKTGEVMLGGSMGGSSGAMPMAAGNRHLEVHVHSRADGNVVAVYPSSISLTDESTMGMSQNITIVKMEGIGEGLADLHYGNNVAVKAGDAYKVVVTIKGEKATFTFKA
jgi:hypothetical protein